jgi:NAD(P)-dependent dehydrogenase (short-subunit alcohol dehydrogenase family)
MALARAGCDVAVNYRRDAGAADETVRAIEGLGQRAVAYRASVDVLEEDEAMAQAVLDDFGVVDILVHSAGIASRGGSVVKTDPAELDRVLATHAVAAHHLCRLLVPTMRRRPRGDVVFISSVAARLLSANGAPYNMAKAALEALAMTLAKEERRHGIHVNVVAPGLVVTEMGRRLVKGAMGIDDISSLDATAPFGRVCRPEDVAGVVAFLCSEEAGYLTGQVISVDGGA